MTKTQFKKLKVFALRMAEISIRNERWKRELKDHVSEILERMDTKAFDIHYSQVLDWENNEPIPGDDGTCGFAWSNHQPLLCDHVTEYCRDMGLEREREHKNGQVEMVESKRAVALKCCLRAACDVVLAPSGGVIGYTVGDIKKMWRGRTVPRWVKAFFEEGFDTFKDDDLAWL